MPTSSGNFFIASTTVTLCAGAHFLKNDSLRPVITAPGTTLLTCTPSLMPCSANAFASAMIAALTAATAAKPGFGSRAALPDMKTTDPFEAFNASQARIVRRAFDEDFDSRRLTQVECINQRFGSCRPHCRCGLLQLTIISRG